jgi:hypothetical protein
MRARAPLITEARNSVERNARNHLQLVWSSERGGVVATGVGPGLIQRVKKRDIPNVFVVRKEYQ